MIGYARSAVLTIYYSAAYEAEALGGLPHGLVVGMGVESYCANVFKAEFYTCGKHAAAFAGGSHAVNGAVWLVVGPCAIFYDIIGLIGSYNKSEHKLYIAVWTDAYITVAGNYVGHYGLTRRIAIDPLGPVAARAHEISCQIVEGHQTDRKSTRLNSSHAL